MPGPGVSRRLVDVRVLRLRATFGRRRGHRRLAARRIVHVVVVPGQQAATVRLGVLVQPVVASTHVDQELGTVRRGVRQRRASLPLGPGEMSDQGEHGRGSRQTTGGRQ